MNPCHLAHGGGRMATQFPEIGQWFKNIETNDLFEVVAYDETDATIELQHFTGEIEEIDSDTWKYLTLIPFPEPDDATGAYELSLEDSLYSDEPFQPENWLGPINGIDILEPDDWY